MNLQADFDAINGCVCVIGSMNADYTVLTEHLPQPGETVNASPMKILPGGKSGNQAAATALLGANVKMFGAVGSDSNADFLLGKLADVGVDISRVMHVENTSGTTLITVDARGENTIVYSPGSNASVTPSYVESEKENLTSASVLGLCLESPMETVMAAARICHDAGMKIVLNDSPFVADLPQILIETSDILLVNKLEAKQLLKLEKLATDDWNTLDWHDIANALHQFGFDSAVITLGCDGSVVIDGDEVVRISPVPIEALDTTGCGDAFMGTILAGLASGFSLSRAARLASYVSAYAALSEGAQASYGSPDQIMARFTKTAQ